MSRKSSRFLSLSILLAATLLLSVQALARPSPSDCAARADRAERGSGSTLGGAGRGAMGGALFGAVIDGGDGAAKGAMLGGVLGGARQKHQRNETYNSVYDACMAGY